MKSKLSLALLIALLAITAAPASAVGHYINGTTYRSDTGGILTGVYIFNGSNSSTSNATGEFSISSMENNTNGWTLTAQFNTNDSFAPNTTVVVVNDANVSGVKANLSVRVPLISGLSVSILSKQSGIISWTSNVSNVGNRLAYSIDPNLATNVFYTDWLNGTTTPSFTLTGLRIATTYYYSASTTNMVNSSAAYTTTSTGSGTTGHGYAEEPLQVVISQPKPTAKPLIDLGAITGNKAGGTPNKGAGLIVMFIIAIGIVAYFWKSKGSSKLKKKRK